MVEGTGGSQGRSLSKATVAGRLEDLVLDSGVRIKEMRIKISDQGLTIKIIKCGFIKCIYARRTCRSPGQSLKVASAARKHEHQLQKFNK